MVNVRFAAAVFLGRGLYWEATYSADPSAYGKDYSAFATMLSTFAFTS
ncbi:MAG: hypothetical protein JOZ41_09445 [Chloroflexi bacterium]|nr:hypothetical protein [Chloroflexota bacterium]